MIEKQNHFFCFGLGFTGLTLARRLRADGWTVAGTCRDADVRDSLRAQGIAAHVFDRDHALDAEALRALLASDYVLVSIPPDGRGDVVADALGALMTDDAYKAWSRQLAWFGYLSTVGVYGDTDGAVVDERAPLNPTQARSKRRVAAEQTWQTLADETQLPLHIFRLPGIYGPGRSVLDKVRAGQAQIIEKPDHVFSRIHVEDLARVIEASMHRPNGGAIYNVTDDVPASPAEVTRYACELMGVTPPQSIAFADIEHTMTPMARSFWFDNKRVSNARMHAELNVALRYPDYKSGLAAIYEASANK